MNTIYKYRLGVADRQVIPMPHGARILCVQFQGHALYLWARVDTTNCLTNRTIVIYGTGDEQGTDGEYIGTVQHGRSSLVLHVFEEK